MGTLNRFSCPASAVLPLSPIISSVATFCFVFQEAVDFGDGSVKCNHFETVVGGVHDKILAHDGQANQAEVTTGVHMRRWADIDASQAHSRVSERMTSMEGFV